MACPVDIPYQRPKTISCPVSLLLQSRLRQIWMLSAPFINIESTIQEISEFCKFLVDSDDAEQGGIVNLIQVLMLDQDRDSSLAEMLPGIVKEISMLKWPFQGLYGQGLYG